MRMRMRMPQARQLPLLMSVMCVVLSVCLAEIEVEAGASDGATGAMGSPRNRIKAEAETLMTVDSFNIRHGRSRSHLLHGSATANSSSGGSSISSITRLLPVPTPTQQPGAMGGGGGTSDAPVTHKIRKLHKKKINESIRKSVDKSLGRLHPPKNHRSLAEAEHLQGRPPSEDAEVAALSEVMELADELESFATPPTNRQFVRDGANYQAEEDEPEDEEADGHQEVHIEEDVNVDGDDDDDDDDNEDDDEDNEDEVELLSTTARPKVVRLQPVNGTWNKVSSNSQKAFSSTSTSSDSDYETNALDLDDEVDGKLFGQLQLANETTTEWLDEDNPKNENQPEAEARSQAASMEMKQISFDSGGDAGDDPGDSVLDTSEVTMDDGYPPDVQIDDKTKQLVIGDVEDSENMESNQITADVINARDSKIDLVSKFLQYIEQQHLMGSNCVAGTSLNLGEGVVDRYAQDRFRVEAEVAVNRANMLTR